MSWIKRWMWVIVIFPTASVFADTAKNWENLSNITTVALPLAALTSNYLNDDFDGAKQFLLSESSSILFAELLKQNIHSRRPDGSDYQSFPSAQTAVSFAAATFMDRRYSDGLYGGATLWYAIAAVTGLSRVKANKHHLEDVIAGGMLGAANAYFWTEPRQSGKNLGVSLLPLSNGLMIGYRFQL